MQILPVILHESRGTLIENCVTSWHEFPYFRKITLTRNMRALSNDIEFVEFLEKIGNDEAPQFPQFGESIIKIPQQLIGDKIILFMRCMETFPKKYCGYIKKYSLL